MPTNFNIGGTDIDQIFVSRDYFITRYPELAGTFKASGLFTWGNGAQGQLGDNTTIQKSSPVQTVAGGTNWQQLQCGTSSFGCIKTNGTLWMWGHNVSGQLGNSSTIGRSSPVQTVSGGTNWKQVSVGGWNPASQTSGAIKTDGTLWMWGSNSSGAIGNNNTISQSSPVQTIAGGTNWKFIAASGTNSAAIKTDGTLWTWGANTFGTMGDNSTINRSSPVQTVASGTNWKYVTANNSITACIKTDGTLWLWGYNAIGVLGDNSTINRSSPVQTVAGGTNWKQVSMGYRQMAAVKTDGTLWMWGSNSSGNLGDNTTIDRSSPVQTIAGGTNWKQVSAGLDSTGSAGLSTAAIKTNGTLWTWGRNTSAQLGDNTTINRSSPVQTIASGFNWISVSAAAVAMAALIDFSTDYLYIPSLSPATQTVSGSVGTAIASTTAYTATYFSGNISYSISPALPTGLLINSSTGVISGTPTAVGNPISYTVTAVGSLAGNATAIITIGVGASLWSWGRGTNANGGGFLGDNTTISKSSPVQTSSGTSTWSQLSYSDSMSGAIKNAGTLWMWGGNSYGQLGDNTTINRSSPVQTVAGTSIWKNLASSYLFTAGIKTDGTLWTWGYNGWGNLGNNSTTNTSSPIQTIAGGTNWSQLPDHCALTTFTMAAIKTDGTLWTWGQNSTGALGNNTTISRSSPVQTIASGTNWRQVSVGYKSIAAIKTDNTLWLWGDNSVGNLGDNSAIARSSPVQTISAGTNWSQVSAGYQFVGAIKTDGTLWMWGKNNFGQLGNNGYFSTGGISSPIQTISGGTNWMQVSAGSFVTSSIKTDGTLWSWGLNSYGASGNNSTSPFRQVSPVQTISGGSNWKQVSAGGEFIGAIKQ
jgi:alpha-tubulin suppressor-like RCC1 family protein